MSFSSAIAFCGTPALFRRTEHTGPVVSVGQFACTGCLSHRHILLCTTGAIQYIGSTPTAILGALEPVTAIFFGIAVFGESLTVRESIGLVMIIVAVTLVIAGGNITGQLVRFRKLFPRLPIKSKKNN